MPDCFEYEFESDESYPPSKSGCVPGDVKLSVAGPQAQLDELVVTATLGSKAGVPVVDLKLTKVIGSMLDRFQKPLGIKVGTVLLKDGAPSALLLGPGLLPSEIGASLAPLARD